LDVLASSRRKDAVGRFLRESGCVRFKSTGYVSVVTADGQTLGIVNPIGPRHRDEATALYFFFIRRSLRFTMSAT
jgi:hypothetical protein